MTHLKRCPKKDCHELIPTDQAACEKHLHRTCRCGCGQPVPPKFLYVPECQRRLQNERLRSWRSKADKKEPEGLAEGRAIKEMAKQKREEPVIVITGEEMDRISRIDEKRLESVRQGLNPELLAERMMRQAVVKGF